MIETDDYGVYGHLLENEPILNGEVIYRAKHDQPERSRSYVDSLDSPSALAVTWREPGEPPAAWLWAEGRERMERALPEVGSLFGEGVFVIVQLSHLEVAMERFFEVGETGELLIYTVDEDSFDPVLGSASTGLGPGDAEELYEIGRDSIIPDVDFIREVLGGGWQVGIRDRRGVAAWAGTIWRSELAEEIGVVVRSDRRRTGLGKQVVSEMTRRILEAGRTPFYQTARSNPGSWSLCESLGYSLGVSHPYYKMKRGN